MSLFSAVLLCILVTTSHASWFSKTQTTQTDISPFRFLVDDSMKQNTSFWERHSLRMLYGRYGISLGKVVNRKAIQLAFNTNNQVEQGRGKKHDNNLITVIIGYKLATIITITLSVMGALVFKALLVAKIALVMSATLLLYKLFHHTGKHYHQTPAYIEFEHGPEHFEKYTETPDAGNNYHPSGAENYYSYANYVPNSLSNNALNYGTMMETSANNNSISNQSLTQRWDSTRGRKIMPFLTIHKFSVKS